MAKRPPTRTQQTSGRRPTKAERREQARRERQELLRKAAVRRKRRKLGTIVGSVVAAAGIAAWVVLGVTGSGGGKKSTTVDPLSLPGILTTEAPWPANNLANTALTRANDIGLSAEGASYHHHDLLQVYINGVKETVPQGVGFCSSGAAPCVSMHTHDTSGIVHLESATPFRFNLGQFFDVWGVRFTPSCVGAYCNQGGRTLRVYLNGKIYTGDPTKLPLTQHEDVVVTYGTAAQLPHPTPSTYSTTISSSCTGSC